MAKSKKDLPFLLGLGAKFFPANVKTKRPIIKEWQQKATSDIDQLRKWAKEFPGCAWGIACGPTGWHVVDVDGADGRRTILDKDMPETLVVKTQSDNRHHIYLGQTANSIRDLPGIDIKSVGGYVLAAGSPGYEIINRVEPVPAPAWSVELAGESGRRERESVVISEDEPSDLEKAQRWLDSTAPISIEGGGGNDNAFQVACRVKDFGISEVRCWDMMLGSWNERCEPPWEAEELLRIIENAYQYAWGDQGSMSAEEDFDDDDLPTEEYLEEIRQKERETPSRHPPVSDHRQLLKWMNARHSQTFDGRALVWSKIYGENGAEDYTLGPVTEINKLYQPYSVWVTDDKAILLGKWWRDHPGAMRSRGFTMRPDLPPGPSGMDKPFNMWTGWGIEPRKGDWTCYRRLIEEGLCAGVKEHSEYVLNWIALLLQSPTTLHKVALVFRGDKGSGKSTLGLALKMALGTHAAKADSAEAVTGRFNWHLKSKVFLLAEEVRWMQGKGGESVLKSLITDPERSYESKGINAVQGQNYISMMITSNEDWVVPASLRDERRYAAFNVDPELKKDNDLWLQIYKGFTGIPHKAPIAAMMYDLLRRDISNFDPIRSTPRTGALAEQALESMNFIQKWWHQCLFNGTPPDEYGPFGYEEWQEGEIEIPVQKAYGNFCDYMPNGRRVPTVISVGREMARFGVRRERTSKVIDGERPYLWKIPKLDEARAKFNEELGLPLEW
jgi:hypothetical protein